MVVDIANFWASLLLELFDFCHEVVGKQTPDYRNIEKNYCTLILENRTFLDFLLMCRSFLTFILSFLLVLKMIYSFTLETKWFLHFLCYQCSLCFIVLHWASLWKQLIHFSAPNTILSNYQLLIILAEITFGWKANDISHSWMQWLIYKQENKQLLTCRRSWVGRWPPVIGLPFGLWTSAMIE